MTKAIYILCAVALLSFSSQPVFGASDRISNDTRICLGCHAPAHPGIVADWEKGRMARITPMAARSMVSKKRRVSFEEVPDRLARVV
ncbi:MAG: hydroxylamine oxidase, partial [Deltaproteobacteria bacterium]|nr:hydroxylamine oxidase [Deltaproteobacteria bacterium]